MSTPNPYCTQMKSPTYVGSSHVFYTSGAPGFDEKQFLKDLVAILPTPPVAAASGGVDKAELAAQLAVIRDDIKKNVPEAVKLDIPAIGVELAAKLAANNAATIDTAMKAGVAAMAKDVVTALLPKIPPPQCPHKMDDAAIKAAVMDGLKETYEKDMIDPEDEKDLKAHKLKRDDGSVPPPAGESGSNAGAAMTSKDAATLMRLLFGTGQLQLPGSIDSFIRIVDAWKTEHGQCINTVDLRRPFLIRIPKVAGADWHIENNEAVCQGKWLILGPGDDEINEYGSGPQTGAALVAFVAHTMITHRYGAEAGSSGIGGAGLFAPKPPFLATGGSSRVKVSPAKMFTSLTKAAIKLTSLSGKSANDLLGMVLNRPTAAHHYNVSWNATRRAMTVSVMLPTENGTLPVTTEFVTNAELTQHRITHDAECVPMPNGVSTEKISKAIKNNLGFTINTDSSRDKMASLVAKNADHPQSSYDALAERVRAMGLAYSLGSRRAAAAGQAWNRTCKDMAMPVAVGGAFPGIENFNVYLTTTLSIDPVNNIRDCLMFFENIPAWGKVPITVGGAVQLVDRVTMALAVLSICTAENCGMTSEAGNPYGPLVPHRAVGRNLIFFSNQDWWGTLGITPADNIPHEYITQSSIRDALALLPIFTGDAESIARGMANALRRSFLAPTLSLTAASLPLRSLFRSGLGDAAEIIAWRRLWVFKATNPRWATANHHRAPIYHHQADGNHQLLHSGHAIAAIVPDGLQARLTGVFGTYAAAAAGHAVGDNRVEPRNVDIPLDSLFFNRGWTSEITDAAHQVDYTSPLSVDSSWANTLLGMRCHTFAHFCEDLARLTTSEKIDLVCWLRDSEDIYNGAPAADVAVPFTSRTFATRWGLDAVEAELDLHIPALTYPHWTAGQADIQCTADTISAGAWFVPTLYQPVSGVVEEAHYTWPAGLNNVKAFVMSEARPSQDPKALSFGTILASQSESGDVAAFDVASAMSLIGMRAATDFGVVKCGLTRSIVALASGVVNTGNKELDSRLPKSNYINHSLSLSAAVSTLVNVGANSEEFLGLDNPLFDIISSGRCSVSLPQWLISGSAVGTDVYTLHHLLRCTPPPLMHLFFSGLELEGLAMDKRASWFMEQNVGNKNFLANFDKEGISNGEFIGSCRRIAAAGGFGYRVGPYIDIIERSVADDIPVPYKLTDNTRDDPRLRLRDTGVEAYDTAPLDSISFYPRVPDYSPAAAALGIDNYSLSAFTFPVKWMEHRSSAYIPEREAAYASGARVDPRTSYDSPLVPIEIDSFKVDVNTAKSYLPRQSVFWGKDTNNFRDSDGMEFAANNGNHYYSRPPAGAAAAALRDLSARSPLSPNHYIRQLRIMSKRSYSRIEAAQVYVWKGPMAARNPELRPVWLGIRRMAGSPVLGSVNVPAAGADFNFEPINEYRSTPTVAQFRAAPMCTRENGFAPVTATPIGPRVRPSLQIDDTYLSGYYWSLLAPIFGDYIGTLSAVFLINFHPFAQVAPFEIVQSHAWLEYQEKIAEKPVETVAKAAAAMPTRKPRGFAQPASTTLSVTDTSVKVGEVGVSDPAQAADGPDAKLSGAKASKTETPGAQPGPKVEEPAAPEPTPLDTSKEERQV
uniref:Coat protein n=1 Tax=Rhizoctonia cerealis megabirnavirus-like virus TaxID=3068669 RepID=A0AA51GGV5_9VIRU|nr:MAG: hypothetical protein [Rhizoctonia cerealis megabirnavirus-like virus]